MKVTINNVKHYHHSLYLACVSKFKAYIIATTGLFYTCSILFKSKITLTCRLRLVSGSEPLSFS